VSRLPVRSSAALFAAAAVLSLANAEGSSPNVLRMVTHLDVSRADIDEAIARVKRAVAG